LDDKRSLFRFKVSLTINDTLVYSVCCFTVYVLVWFW